MNKRTLAVTWDVPRSSNNPVIEQISQVRSANNKLWMMLLDIAMKHAPDETKTVMRAINANDKTISRLVEDLSK